MQPIEKQHPEKEGRKSSTVSKMQVKDIDSDNLPTYHPQDDLL
jgi:hypothetical protein